MIAGRTPGQEIINCSAVGLLFYDYPFLEF
jgi:hypothetical protein